MQIVSTVGTSRKRRTRRLRKYTHNGQNSHQNRHLRRLIRRGSAAALAAILTVSFAPASVVRAADSAAETQESAPEKEEKKEEPAPEPPKPDPAPAEPASEPATSEPATSAPATSAPAAEDPSEEQTSAGTTVSEETTVSTTDGGAPYGDGTDPSQEPAGPQGGEDGAQGDAGQTGGTGEEGTEAGMTGDGTETPATELEENEDGPNEEEGDEEEGIEEALEHDGTNEELIASQRIIHMPVIPEDFRFYTCEGRKAVLRETAHMYAAMDLSAAKVAECSMYGTVWELQSGDGWSYVEAYADMGSAGIVRGFLPTEDLAFEEEAETLLKERKEKEANWKTVQASQHVPAAVMELIRKQNSGTVEALVPWYENEAFTWTRGTTFVHVASERPAIAAEALEILEEPSANARTAGSLAQGGLAYILEETGRWYFVESGDVRGFVKQTAVRAGKEAEAAVSAAGREAFAEAEPVLTWKENKATFYSLRSTKEGVKSNPVRKQIIDLAAKSLGCPYVWGGTDLYHGADCSGFVQTLFRQFGYDLPRVAAAQSVYGTQIPVEDAMPGDLIFFAANGYVYHVALYIGDGKTIEAYSSGYGIIVHHIGNRRAVWATRVIED